LGKAFTRFNACSRVTFSLSGRSILICFLSNFTAASWWDIIWAGLAWQARRA